VWLIYFDVIDLDTGEQHRLIVLAVIKSTLDKLGGELIGRKFEMVLGRKHRG